MTDSGSIRTPLVIATETLVAIGFAADTMDEGELASRVLAAITAEGWRLVESTTRISPEDALQALNGGEPLDLTDLELCVITGSDDERDPDYTGPYELGEIVVLRESTGREPFGLGRKPWKSWVREAHFATLAEALDCQRYVREGGCWDCKGTNEIPHGEGTRSCPGSQHR